MTGRPSIHTDGYAWVKVWTEERTAELHLSLEAPGTDQETTNLLRGQLQDVRRLFQDARRAAGAIYD